MIHTLCLFASYIKIMWSENYNNISIILIIIIIAYELYMR